MQTERTLGRYEIIREIGRGGFATVYQASDSVLGRQIALKLLHPARLEDPQTLSRFRAEARITSQLIHPNIVIVHDAGEIDGQFFIAMQYVAGRNLGQIMADDKAALMPFDGITALLRHMGPALDYAHAHGAIHRDVKQSNILMDARGQAYLSDFGIAKALGTSTTLGLSVSGQFIGTPSYFSPEQADGSKPLDGRSDLYSLAVIAYELSTGVVPFQTDTLASLMRRIVFDPPPAPATLNARVVEPIAGILMKALAKNPDDRYPSGQAFAEAFAGAVQTVRDDTLKGHLMAAATLLKKNDFDGAEAQMQSVLNFDPTHADASKGIALVKASRIEHLLGLADARLKAGDFSAATGFLDHVLAREPANNRALKLKADATARSQWMVRYDAAALNLSALLSQVKQLEREAPESSDPKGVFKVLRASTAVPVAPILPAQPVASSPPSQGARALFTLLLFAGLALGTVIAIGVSSGSLMDFAKLYEYFRANWAIGFGFGVASASFLALLILRRGAPRVPVAPTETRPRK
jgi:serine/threonine protein kinase